ncbi:MAG: hypothetical protein Ta2E_11580 [Mycoplasmoidaceae bacterium]|nr:MAG: hypothetical protein Ta2E_11580 [Mycoplasmoidaceae bacterium]
MIDACNESWLLFFEDNLDNFKIRYEYKVAYLDYYKYYETERNQAFSNKTFKQRLLSLVDEHRTTKYKKTLRYYVIKKSIRRRYNLEDDLNEKSFMSIPLFSFENFKLKLWA